jgi:hypothetical protein
MHVIQSHQHHPLKPMSCSLLTVTIIVGANKTNITKLLAPSSLLETLPSSAMRAKTVQIILNRNQYKNSALGALPFETKYFRKHDLMEYQKVIGKSATAITSVSL